MRKEPPRGEELGVAAPHCYCGRLAQLQTAWAESNPLRRGKNGCGFFVWVDFEMPSCERALMAWLLRTREKLKIKLGVREQERRSCGLLFRQCGMFGI
ncbi:uncharacterized protein Pyn_12390 [Prunus yedoensis var. nudiflora]|uniref:Uncharacterized protein n=1 Tax=Prunus yedoensis var. nudiflora TaxID=2094558 RepID=A0A314ZQW1_PRUYE|nr:uncharacterized protein Pyn_12390 [Prunus yedoensis var. nudiflora]